MFSNFAIILVYLTFIYSMLKDQLLNTKGLQFDNWIFESEKFSGLLKNRSKARVALSPVSVNQSLLPINYYTNKSFDAS